MGPQRARPLPHHRQWGHFSITLASAFLLDWCRAAKVSHIEPLAKVARTLEKKQDLILNWFRAGAAVSSGAVEGLNNTHRFC